MRILKAIFCRYANTIHLHIYETYLLISHSDNPYQLWACNITG